MEYNIIQIVRYLELGEGGDILKLTPAEKLSKYIKECDRNLLTP